VLAHVGVVGRALQGVVERDLHAVALGRPHQGPEVLQGPQGRLHGPVAAVLVADGPGGAGVARLGREPVVPPLAEARPDGVDGREVDHVEAHGREVGQPLHRVAEGAVPAGHPPLGAGEQLVPGGEAGPGPIHHHLQLPVVARGRAPVRVGLHQPGDLVVKQEGRAPPRGGEPLELLQGRLQPAPVAPGHPVQAPAQEGRPLEHLAGDLHPRGQALPEVVGPAPVGVREGLDRVEVARVLLQREARLPAIVAQGRHGHLAPGGVLHRAVAQDRGQGLVPFAEDVGRDPEALAHLALHGEPAALELRLHPPDPDRAGVAPGRAARGRAGGHRAPSDGGDGPPAISPAPPSAGTSRATGKAARTSATRSAGGPPASAFTVRPVNSSV